MWKVIAEHPEAEQALQIAKTLRRDLWKLEHEWRWVERKKLWQVRVFL